MENHAQIPPISTDGVGKEGPLVRYRPQVEVPHLHDRWEDQCALEMEMLKDGAARSDSRLAKAREKGDMGNLRPHRRLTREWIVPLEAAVKEWCEKSRKKRGVKPVSLPLIESVAPGTAAMVALREMMRSLGNGHAGLLALAEYIGTSLEHEARCLAWMEDDPDHWKSVTQMYRRRGSNAAHERRSRISIFNRYVSERIGWVEWDKNQRQRVGLDLLDIAIKSTHAFEVVGDPGWKPNRRSKKPMSRPKVVIPKPSVAVWVRDALEDERVFAPVYLPTLMPPKPWEGPRDGGYWTPYIKTPYLIRFHASHEEQRQRAIDDYDALDMPLVYDALNIIQDTPWRINRRVFDVANTCWENDLAIAGMPRQENVPKPKRPDAEPDSEEMKLWRVKASEVHTANAKRFSRLIGVRRCMEVSKRFLNEERFYFPHMLDFRGRMYPIPSDLSPQGHDLHRGLLTFSNPKPVGKDDAPWLAIHVANVWGHDKESFDDRIAWVLSDETSKLMKLVSDDPIKNRQWAELDDPWQGLAAAFEWQRWQEEGEGMMSSLPLRVDGTCNGLQHLAAMIKDDEVGETVNLIPSDEPRDIYNEVAEAVLEGLKKSESKYADMWYEAMGGKPQRSLTKRPVMILPYGGTISAYFTYCREWLEEVDPKKEIIPEDEVSEAIGFIAKIIRKAVESRVTSGVEVMKWLQQCSSRASKTGLPLYWITPAGFVVRHFYGQRVKRRIETNIDSQRIQIVEWETSPTLDIQAQAKGIAPNFVHSMDASALMLCVCEAAANGIESVTSIHDAYGTVCADMYKLYECIRMAFVTNYETDVLGEFLSACSDVEDVGLSPSSAPWPTRPQEGKLDLQAIRNSDYFFA